MPGRAIDNGRLTDVTLEYEAGPSGDIQVVTEKQLAPIAVAASGDRRFTVSTASIGFPNLPATANRALMSVEANAIRWLDDGNDPTATAGHLLTPPASDATYFWILGRTRLTNFRMIRASADATVQVSYYT
jgi:hypothetical protein